MDTTDLNFKMFYRSAFVNVVLTAVIGITDAACTVYKFKLGRCLYATQMLMAISQGTTSIVVIYADILTRKKANEMKVFPLLQ